MYWVHLAMRVIVCLTLGTLGASALIGVFYWVGRFVSGSYTALDNILTGVAITVAAVVVVMLILILGCYISHALHIHIPL